MVAFPEHDWRLLKVVHRTALDRFCGQVLEQCARTILLDRAGPHERYLTLFRLLQDQDKKVAFAFNDLRRSTAIERLAAMLVLGVVTDEELGKFSAPTQESSMALAEIWRGEKKGR